MNLYFVEGVSMDKNLLVRAYTADEALTAWSQYFELDPQAQQEPSRILLVPEEPPKGAIPWDDMTTVWEI